MECGIEEKAEGRMPLTLAIRSLRDQSAVTVPAPRPRSKRPASAPPVTTIAPRRRAAVKQLDSTTPPLSRCEWSNRAMADQSSIIEHVRQVAQQLATELAGIEALVAGAASEDALDPM